jgi:hypothetical protein
MSHKFYVTDWIPELGRYAIIIAAFQNPQTKNLISESFVFAIDKEPQFYHAKRFIYSFPDIPECNDVIGYNDEASVHDHALRYAEAIILVHNDEVSKKTNNRDIVLKEWKGRELGAFIVLGEIYRKYQEELKGIKANTESDDLKKTIRSFLKVMGFNPIKNEPI